MAAATTRTRPGIATMRNRASSSGLAVTLSRSVTAGGTTRTNTGRAARQAAWVLRGELPQWKPAGTVLREADPTPSVRARYAEVRDLTATRV